MAGGLNLYGFAAGDPVNFTDPFGLTPCLIPPVSLVCTEGLIATGIAISIAVTKPAGRLLDILNSSARVWTSVFAVGMTNSGLLTLLAGDESKQIRDAIGAATGERATDEQQRDMGKEIHDRKAHGEHGTKNRKGDFTFDELKQIARDLFGGEPPARR